MCENEGLLPSEQTFIHSCLDWTAAGIWCVCLGNVSVVVRVHTHARVCVCVCFVCAQVSCALTEVSFPSIFEESVLASFSLEATLHGGASDSDFHFEVEGFRAPCISAA